MFAIEKARDLLQHGFDTHNLFYVTKKQGKRRSFNALFIAVPLIQRTEYYWKPKTCKLFSEVTAYQFQMKKKDNETVEVFIARHSKASHIYSTETTLERIARPSNEIQYPEKKKSVKQNMALDRRQKALQTCQSKLYNYSEEKKGNQYTVLDNPKKGSSLNTTVTSISVEHSTRRTALSSAFETPQSSDQYDAAEGLDMLSRLRAGSDVTTASPPNVLEPPRGHKKRGRPPKRTVTAAAPVSPSTHVLSSQTRNHQKKGTPLAVSNLICSLLQPQLTRLHLIQAGQAL